MSRVVAAKVTTSFHGGIRLAATLRKMRQNLGGGVSVRVGFNAGARYPNGQSVAQVAFWNEFGTPNAQHPIPARPFIRSMIAEKSPTWGLAMGAALRNNRYNARDAAEVMGEGLKGQLVQSIVNFTDPPNAPATIAGKGFDKPLIDTALMIRSVDYEIVEGAP